MGHLSVALYKTDFSARLDLPGLKLVATPISWRHIGGPDSATIVGKGDWDADEAANLLRCPVEIFAENGDCVWWGYVDNVRVIDGAVEYGIGMESVANDIMVLYPKSAARAVQIQTYWSSTIYGTSDSMTLLGTKQKQTTTNAPKQSAGDALRDTLLQAYQWPRPIIRHSPTSKDRRIELNCKGWYDTLNWKYYDGVVKRYDDRINGVGWHNTWTSQLLGDTIRAIGQKIAMPYSGTIDAIGANWAMTGEPSKPVKMYIFADGATPGAWGTELASAEATKDRIEQFEGFEWEVYKLNTSVAKAAGDNIWLVFDSQVNGTGDDFKTWIKEGAGTAKVHNGTSWGDPGTAFNMIYRLYLTTDSGDQITDIVSLCGQFITGNDHLTTGINTASQMGAITSAKSVLDNIIEMGTSNNKPLVVKVDRNRFMWVYEDTVGSATTATLILRRDGMLYNISGGEPFSPYADPCGKWCIVDGLIPSTVSATRSIDASCFKIARATYNAGDNRVTLEPEGITSPFEAFAVARK